MSHAPRSVTVTVPGSTSNLGPGFDTLGIALRVYNRVRVTPRPVTPTKSAATAKSRFDVEITSPIANEARPGATALVREAARAFFRRTGQAPLGFDIHLSGDVPIARGLGSSVTVRLGTVAALNALTDAGLDAAALFELVSDLEGHPDNAAPATFGGFTASAMIDGVARSVRLNVAKHWQFVTLVPGFEISTEAARRLVPDSFSKADTVHNLTRVSLITAAFATGNAEALRGAFSDRVHQPYRQRLIPELSRVIRAGEAAGAVGGWLSGSGSTIICLTEKNAAGVAKAMSAKLRGAHTYILQADTRGYRVAG